MINSLKKKFSSLFINSPIGYRFAKGAFWSLAGAAISRGLQLLSFIIIARILGKVSFGELSIIQSTLGLFGTVAGFGLGLSATKFIAEFKNTDKEKTARIRALTSAVAWITTASTSFLLFIFAPIIAEKFLAAPQIENLLKLSTLYLFFTSINGAQTGTLAGFEAFKNIAKINFANGVLSFPLILSFTFFWKIDGAVLGMVISSFLLWLITHFAVRKECRINNISYSYKNFWQEKEVIIKFSVPSVLSSLMVGPIIWYTNALLVNQANGYAEFGIYSAVNRIKQLPEMILGTLMTPLLPLLSELSGKLDRKKYSATLKMAFKASLFIIVPFALVQIAFPQITFLPYGKDYGSNPYLVQWLMFHSILIGIFFPMSVVLSSLNKMWYAWFYNLVWGVIYFGLSFYLVPIFQATGLAASLAITHFITSMGVVIIIKRKQNEIFEFVPFYKYLTIVFLALIIVFVIFSIFN